MEAMECFYPKKCRHIPDMSMHRAIVLFSVGAVDGVCPTDGLVASIWGILTQGNMMLHDAMRQEAKRLSPSAQFLWEGRRRWCWQPREQPMALP